MSNNSDSGNVLFLILIAVALFAALSYVVTQSGRSGSGSISNEDSRLIASRILNQLQSLKTGYIRVSAVNGCADNQIGFYSPGTRYAYPELTPNGVGNLRSNCNVFDRQGGAVIPEEIPRDAGTVTFSSNPYYDFVSYVWMPQRAYVANIGTNYVTGTDFETSEHMVAISFARADVCVSLNEMLGVNNPGGSPPSGGHQNLLTGECMATENRVCSPILRLGYPGNLPDLNGKLEGCFHAPSNSYMLRGPRYVFYSVLDPG